MSRGTALFLFRRDLRLPDNTGLIDALRSGKTVIPCFIFDPRQLENHPYRSAPGLRFLAESLQDLDRDLHEHGSALSVLKGAPDETVAQLILTHRIDAVYCNRDYTPFARKRDKALEDVCKKAGIAFVCTGDALLHEPEETLKKDGTPYTVYSPFAANALSLPVREPQKLPKGAFAKHPLPHAWKNYAKELLSEAAPSRFAGGRTEGLKLLRRVSAQEHYAAERDLPALDSTTHLSPHHKFGTVSPRETFHAVKRTLGGNHTLIKELLWRDFFTGIGFHFPHVFGHAFHKKYDAVQWPGSAAAFHAWCEGKTGFPIVDAGMRELLATGYMHNRVRMVTASFLTKDLHVDWRKGEAHFARHLADFDPAVNNGNWQWAASTGCDAQPYFRIFNPWLQQKRFDPDCTYIRRWIPELKKVPTPDMHKWEKAYSKHAVDYPKPMCDHGTQANLAKRLYERV